MEYRQLGYSGLKVPVITLGAGTFGGSTEFFKKWGSTQVDEAKQLVSVCLEAGANLFDVANAYSLGAAEEILGKAIAGRRNDVLISTKASIRMGEGPNNLGSSRFHVMEQVHASLKRLGTEHIDIYHMHIFDAITPIEETLETLDTLVKQGKIRYIAASNFSGWHLMKSLAISEKHHWQRYVAHQVYYSLVGRDYEWELMPLGLDQKVGALVWSPLGWGRLTGKIRRGQPAPKDTRLGQGGDKGGPVVEEEYLYKVIAALDAVAEETGKSVPQIALNWLLTRPTVSSLVIGARNESQLRANLDAVSFTLTAEQIAKLEKASERPRPYPYWHQLDFQERNPLPVPDRF
jgi:aryl-alcohol dehydrogenase-like predicted oxidoreductase